MRDTARNGKEIGQFLGDPTRWGATVSWRVFVEAGTDTGYVVGPDAVLMQFSDLRARTVDVICQYEIEGIDVGDGPFQVRPDGYTGFGLRWTVGGGQTSFTADSAAVYTPALAAPGLSWARYIENNHVVKGVMQNQIPVPLASLVIRPVFRVKGPDVGKHFVKITATIQAAPRA